MGERFLGKLDGVTYPETKRKIIGNGFILVLEEEKQKLKEEFGHIDYLVQGTIYPGLKERQNDVGKNKFIEVNKLQTNNKVIEISNLKLKFRKRMLLKRIQNIIMNYLICLRISLI